MRKKWKKKIESVSHRQQYPSDSSSASESSVSEDSCSSEQQETTPYARSGSSLNPLRWRNQTFDVDGTVEPQESNYCRHRKGIQADFQRDENKETNVAVSNAPPEANSFIEANPSKEQLYALTNAEFFSLLLSVNDPAYSSSSKDATMVQESVADANTQLSSSSIICLSDGTSSFLSAPVSDVLPF